MCVNNLEELNISDLQVALIHSWNADTAFGEWSPECPPLNQCAVTALVVQDLFGGDLLRCEMTNGDSHYWNRLSDGMEIDLTESQFSFVEPKPLRDTVVVRDRDYVLSFPETVVRYELLIYRVRHYLFGP